MKFSIKDFSSKCDQLHRFCGFGHISFLCPVFYTKTGLLQRLFPNVELLKLMFSVILNISRADREQNAFFENSTKDRESPTLIFLPP